MTFDSPNEQPLDWRQVCFGREELLTKLQDSFGRVKSGLAEVNVLLGMTGIGKTRLAQELYRWIAKEHDPVDDEFPLGYWPDSFFSEADQDKVNPTFDHRPRPPIPFLWWGIKFRENYADEALGAAQQYLSTHVLQVAVARQIQEIHAEWFWKSLGWGMTGLGMIPGIGTIASLPGWIKDGWDLRQKNKEKQIKQQEAGDSVLNAAANARQNHLRELAQVLKLFLDPSASQLPTVPVVLFLDDAHWADPVTLGLVRQLYSEAREKKWPLMVIATHWDDEWNLQKETSKDPQSPLRLAHFLDRLAPAPRAGFYQHHICGVEENALRLWLNESLPGLSESQCQLLLRKSRAAATRDGVSIPGGSPRVLRQFIEWLLVDPFDSFVDGTPQSPLKPGVEQTIEEHVHDLHDIIEKRFKKLDRNVRKALGWSSRQGERFLSEITKFVAEQLSHPNTAGPTGSEISEGLQRSVKPHHWIDEVIQTEVEPGRYNLCEFRSNVFHEIASRHFTRDQDEIKAVDAAVRSVLTSWIHSGRLMLPEEPQLLAPDQLSISERRDALRMAWRLLHPDQPDASADSEDSDLLFTYGLALTQLVDLEINAWKWDEPVLWEQAEAVALAFAAAFPQGCPRSIINFWQQITVIDVLETMHEYYAASSLIEPLVTELIAAHASIESLRELAVALQRQGDIQYAWGHRMVAFHSFVRLLEVSQQVQLGINDAKSLRNVSVSLNKVADAMRDLGKKETEIDGEVRDPLCLYLDSLALCRQIVEQFGESPASLRDVSISLERVADAMRDLGKKETEIDGEVRDPLCLYLDSLALCRQIVEQFGESPASLRDVSVSLNKVADAMRDLGKKETEIDGEVRDPLSLYLDSLFTRRQIVEQFGESPASLRDVSISLERVADAMRDLGKKEIEIDGEVRDPLSLYLDSLFTRRQIVEQFGESPESLRDVFVSLSRMILMAAEQTNKQGACAHSAEAETLLKLMAKRGWKSPQWQQDKDWLTAIQAELDCGELTE